MTALADARLRIVAPAGWHRAPGGDATTWAAGLLGEAVPAAIDALAAVGTAAAARRGIGFVLLEDGPGALAWAFVRVLPRDEPDAAAAAAAALAVLQGPAREDEVAVWHREVRAADVDGRPSVLLTDLLTVDRGDDLREVQRRAVVAVFPPEPVCLHVTISTPSSTALPDLAAAAIDLAAGVSLEAGA